MEKHNNKEVRPTDSSVCQINRPFHPDRKVVARFDGGRLSSDAGLVCVWALDQQRVCQQRFVPTNRISCFYSLRRSLSITKELTFHQLGGHRRAVHLDEGFIAQIGLSMDHPSNKVFPYTAFSLNQHRNLGFSNLEDGFVNAFHFRTADHQINLFGFSFGESTGHMIPGIEGAGDGLRKLLKLNGFANVVPDPKPSAPKLGEMFPQVVGTLFRQFLGSRDLWKLNGGEPQTPPIFKCCNGSVKRPQLSTDYKTLKQLALDEFSAQKRLILEILPERLCSRIEVMFERQILRLTAVTWTEIVYSFLRAYASASDPHQQLKIVEALKPLYLARIVVFIRDTLDLDHVASEEKLVKQAEIFWLNRRKLLAAFPTPTALHQRNDPSRQRSTRSISAEAHAFSVS